MQIQLQQSDIEQAIKDYVVKMGLTRKVENINFSQTRKDGASINAEITLEPLLTSSPCVLGTVNSDAANEKAAPVAEEKEVQEPEADTKEEVEEEQTDTTSEETAPVAAGASIFG